MYTFLTILAIIVCILLVLVVLVQNPKGGGLASQFGAANQMMGVKKTTDFLEKATWTLAIALFAICLGLNLVTPGSEESAVQQSAIQEQVEGAQAAQPQASPSAVPAQSADTSKN